LIEELISHPKERAEHIMLIDLERNDLGRICQPGTVEVNELMVVETYEHVHHIVSNVRGQLQDGFDPLDIVHALFPGGTITGCPKVRCMEIIAELEQMPREAYTGSLGYINRDGSLDLNILIRTMLHSYQHDQSVVQFRAGAGIVADSVADNELTETRHKAKGLINALQSQG
jgi:Anthranilate/para-aminobenzoate synthases component I